jgi:hypothetical protein
LQNGRAISGQKEPEKENSAIRNSIRQMTDWLKKAIAQRRCGRLRDPPDYRLRRSRRALRFLLPTFRRRRGLDIEKAPFSLIRPLGGHSGRVP